MSPGSNGLEESNSSCDLFLLKSAVIHEKLKTKVPPVVVSSQYLLWSPWSLPPIHKGEQGNGVKDVCGLEFCL